VPASGLRNVGPPVGGDGQQVDHAERVLVRAERGPPVGVPDGLIWAAEQPPRQQHDRGEDADGPDGQWMLRRNPQPVISDRPMTHSTVANRTSATLPGINPKVSS
jgi:hypothetical protein